MSTPRRTPTVRRTRRRGDKVPPPERRWDLRELEILRDYNESMRIAKSLTLQLNLDYWSLENIMSKWEEFYKTYPRFAPKDFRGNILFVRRPFKWRITAVRFFQMVDLFGAPSGLIPTILNVSEGEINHIGRATWIQPRTQKRGAPELPFLKKLVIKDEFVAHFHPAPHVDFLYSTMEVPYQRKKDLDKLTEISESISVNKRLRTVKGGCHFLSANLATHYVTCMYLNGEIDYIARAREMYGQKIRELKAEFDMAEETHAYLMMPAHQHVIAYLNNVHYSHVRTVRLAVEMNQRKSIEDTPSPEKKTSFVLDYTTFVPVPPLQIPEGETFGRMTLEGVLTPGVPPPESITPDEDLADMFGFPSETLEERSPLFFESRIGDSVVKKDEVKARCVSSERLAQRRKPASTRSPQRKDPLTRPRISSRRLGM